MEQDIINNYNCPVKPKYCPVCKLNYNGKLSECPICKRKSESMAINKEIRERQKTMNPEVKKKNAKKISERIKENKWDKEKRANIMQKCNQEYNSTEEEQTK